MTDDTAVTEDAADESATEIDTDALESDALESDALESDAVESDAASAVEVAEPKRKLPSPRIIAAVAAFVGLLTGAGVLGWQVWQARQIDHAGQEAQRTAEEARELVLSLWQTISPPSSPPIRTRF